MKILPLESLWGHTVIPQSSNHRLVETSSRVLDSCPWSWAFKVLIQAGALR